MKKLIPLFLLIVLFGGTAAQAQIGQCTVNPTKRSEAGNELTANQYDDHVTATRDLCQLDIGDWPTSGVTLDMTSGSLIVPYGTTLPGTCTVGSVFFDSDATPVGEQLYGCTSTDTWTKLGDGGGGSSLSIEEDNVEEQAGATAIDFGSGFNVVCSAGECDITFDGADAQTVTGDFDFGGGTLQIPNGTTLPGTCEVGDQFMDTDATTSQRHYLCESTDTWALQGDGGGVEANDLEGAAPANILDTEILIGTGSGTANFAVISNDATMANTGALTVNPALDKSWTGDHDFGGGTVQVPNSATLPGTCEVGDTYMDTDATSGQRFFLCETANSWVVQGDGGGAEVNNLETADPPNVADTEIYIGNGAGSGTWNVISNDAALSNTGALTIVAGLTKAWTGSHDFGGGTLEVPNSATLPGTCVIGQQYWDTDADTDGSLYVCRATNTWKEVDDDGAGGSLTVEESDASPSVTSVTTLEFNQADGFSVVDETGGVARVDFTNPSVNTVTQEYDPDQPPSSCANCDEFEGSENLTWRWGNQGTSTATVNLDGLEFLGEDSTGDNLRVRWTTVNDTGDFFAAVKLDDWDALSSFEGAGIAALVAGTEGTPTNIRTCMGVVQNATDANVQYTRWNSYTSFNATHASLDSSNATDFMKPMYIGLEFDDTADELSCYFSRNGYLWTILGTAQGSITDVDSVGLVVNNNNTSGGDRTFRFDWFRSMTHTEGLAFEVGGPKVVGTTIQVAEIDNVPNVLDVVRIEVPNGSLTDDTNGQVTIAEVNDLEGSDPASILDTEIYIGTGAGTGSFAAIGGDASMANDGTFTISESLSKAWTGDFDFGGGVLQVPNSNTRPGTCDVGDAYMDTDETSGARWYLCETANTWVVQGGGGGSPAFSAITNGTNVSAAMVVSAGASLEVSPVKTGAMGAWDLQVGSVATHGGIRIGDSSIYSSSFTSVNTDLGQTMVFRQEADLDVTNDPGIEFAFLENTSNDIRFAIPEAATGNAMAFLRSGTFAGPYTSTIGNDIVSCDQWTAYDSNIDCDTGTTGSDLFVMDDFELEGDVFVSGGTIKLDSDDANSLTISATSQTAPHTFDFPDDEIVSGDLMVGDGAGSFIYAAPGGDVTMDGAGAFAVVGVGANAVALATDTTGAFVSDLTGGTAVTVSGGGAENANVTVNLDTTSSPAITGDWNFGGGGIEIENGTSPPACTEGQIFMDTDATSGQRLMACEGGTFVVQGDGAGGGTMSSFLVGGDAGTDMTVADGEEVNFAGGLGLATLVSTGTPEQVTHSFDYAETLAGNPAFGAEECVFSTDGAGAGAFLCEGSVADAFEGLFTLPDVTGADDTQVIVTDSTVLVGDVHGTSGATIVDSTKCTGSQVLAGDGTCLTSADPDAQGDGFVFWDDTGDTVTTIDYDLTLAGNPTALAVEECFFSVDGAGSGILCEGSVADAFEGLFLLPNVTGADSTQNILTDTAAATITADFDFSGGGIEIENGATPPACTEGQIYMDTDATSGQRLMACEGGTFVVQGDGGGAPGTDSVGTAELDDDANTPVAGNIVVVETGAASFDYIAPNAGTDVTADLEEDAHAAEHDGVGTVDNGEAIDTASQEAGFLEDGAAVSLTCGASNQGKMQVMDDGSIEYCDGATTSVLQAGFLDDTAGDDDVPESGDFGFAADLESTGAISANAVALGTDTTGAFVQDLTGGTAITVSGGGAEDANVTVNLDTTASPAITGDWDFSGGGIEIENGTTPPACTEGQLYLDTDATAGQQLMACDGGTFVVQGDGGGSEVNDLETDDPASILVNEIYIGTGTGAGAFAPMGGAATMSSTGVVTLADAQQTIGFSVWSLSADGTQCSDPAEVTINSGPKIPTIICTDNAASIFYGSYPMPDDWDGGTITFELQALNTAADTNVFEFDFSAQCRGDGDAVNSTWSSGAGGAEAASITFTTANDIEHDTTAAITPDGTCAAGDTLFFRAVMDNIATTTAVATAHVVGLKMEYTGGFDAE